MNKYATDEEELFALEAEYLSEEGLPEPPPRILEQDEED